MKLTIDKESYEQLSFEVGLFCGQADKFLGRSYFGPLARAKAWELTREQLALWRQEARGLGVPANIAGRDAP